MKAVRFPTAAQRRVATLRAPSTFVMAAVLIALGFYLVYPVLHALSDEGANSLFAGSALAAASQTEPDSLTANT